MTKPISNPRWACIAALLLAYGCGTEAAPLPDAGDRDGGGGMDADVSDSGGADASAASCVEARVESWELFGADDVSIAYRARINPRVGERIWDLYLEFNRYDAEYVGEFPLGTGMDGDYGSCAHCVIAFSGGGRAGNALFARAGTLTLSQDPFRFRLDAVLRDVRLQEVRLVGPALEIEPVPGGVCVELVETRVERAFAPPEWRCAAEQYWDGEACHCECGTFDPDCDWQCPLPPDPACDPTPRPIVGCGTGDLCTWEGRCVETCDWAGRAPCTSGFCGLSFEGDRCFDPAVEPVSHVNVGEPCAVADRMHHCAIDGAGFAMGLCDPDNWICRAICSADEECTTEGDICWGVFVDPVTGASEGYCMAAPPPCRPSGEPCTEHLDCCTVLCEGGGTCG